MGKSGRYLGVLIVVALVGGVGVAEAIDYHDPASLDRLISDQTAEYLLLDVRTAAEFESGHIPTAVNLPYEEVAARMPNVAKDSLVIVYCASGRRASIATKTLDELGYTSVINFGGISRWTGRIVTGSE